ncbi:MAG TPA: hypothetical protein VMU59_09280 [Caulobacteraceae bacterium]|nr:hypothetical protein [Caulobacteraceae bacterium]
MPIGLAQSLPSDLDAEDSAGAALPVPASAGYAAAFDSAHQLTDRAAHVAYDVGASGAPGAYGPQFSAPTRAATPLISADQANAQYGVPGYTRFNAPVNEDDAAWLSAQGKRQQIDDTLLARSNPNPLLAFGAGLAGSLTDPLGLSAMLATGGLGDLALGAIGLRGAEAAGETGLAITRLGKLANAAGTVGRTLAVGAIDNAPYVGLDAAATNEAGQSYSPGDALRDIAAGAILHTTVHMAGRAFNGLLGKFAAADGEPDPGAVPNAFEPNPVPPSGVPDAVNDLPTAARQGAFAMALDQATNDEPVDVGQYVERELAPNSLDRLNEPSAEPAIDSWRPLDPDTAVTARGTEIPVRYGLAELGDLTTSHDDNLAPNPAYPPELQPRDRARAGAQARNYQLEQELNPRLLMNDVGAGAGAPIVSPDGVVESGNGRTIALRRSAANGTPAYQKYVAALNAAGFDTTGLKAPILARMRTEPLDGASRAALAREMNADVTERMGATEQAMQDGARIPDSAFDQIADNQGPTTSRDFARTFIARVAPDQANVLAAGDGALSPEGARRIKAAVLARAYGDPRLVGQIFEGEESDARKMGEALAEGAPAWARLRAAAATGAIPRELDLTDNLTGAMDLVRYAASEKRPLGEIVADLIGQGDMFSGSALSPATEAFLRMMYRDAEFKKPTAPAKLAAALKDYVRQALKVTPGEDLFGETAGEDTARQILANAAERFARGDAGDIDIVRPPGPTARAAGADAGARPSVVDLEQPRGERDGGGRGEPQGGGAGAEGEGGEPGSGGAGASAPEPVADVASGEVVEKGPDPSALADPETNQGGGAPGPGPAGNMRAGGQNLKGPTGEQLIAADPELRALAEDTDRLAAENGVEAQTAEKDQPNTLAEAIRAAAVCLMGEAE